ncbi:Zinc finger C2HC domain-containing protein 1C [Chytriomyces hyalinus]|nr:Zinc finger C2HC domain-containing protein 1C [Chytriomyces hyalinus]
MWPSILSSQSSNSRKPAPTTTTSNSIFKFPSSSSRRATNAPQPEPIQRVISEIPQHIDSSNRPFQVSNNNLDRYAVESFIPRFSQARKSPQFNATPQEYHHTDSRGSSNQYINQGHQPHTPNKPTNVFVSVELPKELVHKQNTPNSLHNSHSKSYDSENTFSLEANSMMPPPHPSTQNGQYYAPYKSHSSSKLPFLTEPPHIQQQHRSELERLNRRAGFRDIDGEGRPIVSRNVPAELTPKGSRENLLNGFLSSRGSASSLNMSGLGDSTSTLLAQPHSSSSILSMNSRQSYGSIPNGLDRAGSRSIEALIKSQWKGSSAGGIAEERDTSDEQKYVPSTVENGSNMQTRRKIPLHRPGLGTLPPQATSSREEFGSGVLKKSPNGSNATIDTIISTSRQSLAASRSKIPSAQSLGSANKANVNTRSNLNHEYESPKQKISAPTQQSSAFRKGSQQFTKETSFRDDHIQRKPEHETPSDNESEHSYGSEHSIKIHAQLGQQHSLPPEQDDSIQLSPCRVCGRRFAVDRLQKHERACAKSSKPRKAFDPAKMRKKGTDMESNVRKNEEAERKLEQIRKAKKETWKQKHGS